MQLYTGEVREKVFGGKTIYVEPGVQYRFEDGDTSKARVIITLPFQPLEVAGYSLLPPEGDLHFQMRPSLLAAYRTTRVAEELPEYDGRTLLTSFEAVMSGRPDLNERFSVTSAKVSKLIGAQKFGEIMREVPEDFDWTLEYFKRNGLPYDKAEVAIDVKKGVLPNTSLMREIIESYGREGPQYKLNETTTSMELGFLQNLYSERSDLFPRSFLKAFQELVEPKGVKAIHYENDTMKAYYVFGTIKENSQIEATLAEVFSQKPSPSHVLFIGLLFGGRNRDFGSVYGSEFNQKFDAWVSVNSSKQLEGDASDRVLMGIIVRVGERINQYAVEEVLKKLEKS